MPREKYKNVINRILKRPTSNILTRPIIRDIKPVKNENLPVNRINNLDVVMTCVNYGDFLSVSLNENIKYFSPKRITVVTDGNDIVTQKICDLFGVNCVITDKFYEDGAVFNKGKGINEGINSIKDPEWILLTDADIVFPSNIIDVLSKKVVDQNVLYSASRFLCHTYEKFLKYKNNEIGLIDMGDVNLCQPKGYFQLFYYFHPRLLNKDYCYPITSKDASWSDLEFSDCFKEQKECIDDIKLIHLGEESKNWRGRVTKKFLNDEDLVNIIENYQGLPFNISEREYDGEDKLCVITTYFNSSNYENLRKNYLTFKDNINKCGVDLFTIELSFDDNFFIDESDKNIRIIGDENTIMWQKERLLNILLEKIPEEYNNIAWIDCDVIFENPNWVNEINDKLHSYKMLQLFENVSFYNESGSIDNTNEGLIKNISKLKTDKFVDMTKHPGLGWAIRREIITNTKFMDLNILGGADTIMALAGIGSLEKNYVYNLMNIKWYSQVMIWSNNFFKSINKSIFYVSGNVLHLYHGNVNNRQYEKRAKYLSENNYDPNSDIVLNENNVWQWSSNKPNLKNSVKNYFSERYEDDNINELSLNSYFDAIFCINLDRRQDKWANVSKRFKKNNIIVERVRGYDGKWDIVKNEWEMTKKNLQSKYGDQFNINPSVCGLIENEFAYGTLCTHITILRLAKQRKLNKILVLEDDILFNKKFNVLLKQLSSFKSWKLLYLGASQYDWTNLEIINKRYYHPKKTMGGFAYAIDSSVFDELLLLALRMEKSFDNCLGNFNGEDIQTKYRDDCYVVYPNMIIADVRDSDIREKRDQDDHSKRLRWNLSDYDLE